MLDFCCSINIGHQVFDEIFTKIARIKNCLLPFLEPFTKRRQFLEHLLQEDSSVFIEIL